MAGNDDFDEGQQRALAINSDGAASERERVAVPSREETNSDSSDSDDGAPKLPPAVRKLADTLSSGERDGAPRWLSEAEFTEANQPLLEAYLLRRLLRACAAQVRLNPKPDPNPNPNPNP